MEDAFGRRYAESHSLTTLERHRWGPPGFASRLVVTCHRLRDVPLVDLDIEDVRILIGQNIGLAWLVPRALDQLERDPFVSGDFGPGDLLGSVLRADPAFYARVPRTADRVRRVLSEATKRYEAHDAEAVYTATFWRNDAGAWGM